MTKSVVSTIVILLIFGACFVYAANPDAGASKQPTVGEAKFDPPQPMTGQPIKLQIKLEGTAIRAEVKWSINDEEVETSDYDGLEKPVELRKKTTAGDKVVAVVIPYDGIGASGANVTKQVVVGPAPPVVKISDQKIVGNTYSAHVDAVDPQGGPVKFTVNQAPEGLSIDSRGDITWKVSESVSGSFPVVITATDEKGANSVVSFTINLKWQKGK